VSLQTLHRVDWYSTRSGVALSLLLTSRTYKVQYIYENNSIARKPFTSLLLPLEMHVFTEE
jgi:hypothetical protein